MTSTINIAKNLQTDWRQRNSEFHERLLIVLFFVSIFIIDLNLSPQIGTVFKYVVIPVTLALLMRYDSFKLMLYPLLFLDDSIGTYVANRLTLLWFYLIIIFVLELMVRKKKAKYTFSDLIILFFLLYFVILGLSEHGMVYIKIFCVVFITQIILKQIESNSIFIRKFQFVVIYSALIPAISLILGLGGSMTGYNRQVGFGFSDPNYSAVVCALGLCCSLNISEQKKIWKVLQIIYSTIFVLAIISTISITGIILIAVILLMKLLYLNGVKRKIKGILIITLTALLVFAVIIPNINWQNWDAFIIRIIDVIGLRTSSTTNYSAITSGRTNIFSAYLSYFENQNGIKILFGGNVLNCNAIFGRIGMRAVTHNVYIDYLLAFGVFGALVLISIYIKKAMNYFRKFHVIKDTGYLSVAMMKIVMLVAGISLAYLESPFWWLIFVI